MSAITKKSQYLANTDVNPSTEMIRIPRRTRWGKSSTSYRELIDQVSTLLITTHILQNFPLIDGVLNSPGSGLAGNFPSAKSFKLPNLEVNSAGETQQTGPIGWCCHLGQHMVRLSIITLLAGQWRMYYGLAFSILDHYGGPNTYSDCSFKDGFLFLIHDRIVLPVSSQLRQMCKKNKIKVFYAQQ